MYIAPIRAPRSPSAPDTPDALALDAAGTLFAPYLLCPARERLVIAGFDTRSRLRAFAEAAGEQSCVDGLLRLTRRALGDADVSILVVGHNHPSGLALPSRADREATRRVAALCRLAGAQLAGHLLFAGTRCVLFGGSRPCTTLPLASEGGRSYSAALPGSGAAPAAHTGVKVGE